MVEGPEAQVDRAAALPHRSNGLSSCHSGDRNSGLVSKSLPHFKRHDFRFDLFALSDEPV
jgi:hypothetical protein